MDNISKSRIFATDFDFSLQGIKKKKKRFFIAGHNAYDRHRHSDKNDLWIILSMVDIYASLFLCFFPDRPAINYKAIVSEEKVFWNDILFLECKGADRMATYG